MSSNGIGKDVFTTGQVAKICHVAPRTVSKWFDAGKLSGYLLPDSQDRRIPRASLRAFLESHHMSEALALLGPEPPPPPDATPSCLLAGLPAGLEQGLHELLLATATVRVARTLFEVGAALRDPPQFVALDLSIGSRDEVRHAVGRLLEECKGVVVVLPEDFPGYAVTAFHGAKCLAHPTSAETVAEAMGVMVPATNGEGRTDDH